MNRPRDYKEMWEDIKQTVNSLIVPRPHGCNEALQIIRDKMEDLENPEPETPNQKGR